MDFNSLKRDAKRVKSFLRELDDGRLITMKECKIYIPVRFAERGLAKIGIETYIVGIYPIVMEDQFYAISNVNAMVRIEPTSTMQIEFDGSEYYEFTFAPGSTVIATLNLVKEDTLVYRIYDEILSKGRVPWYLTYQDLGKIFDTALYHANASVGQNHEVTEMMISLIARDATDRHFYYRSTVETLEDVKKKQPVFIPLRSVIYAATNTTNKLAGSYFHEGLVSALVTPTTRTEKIESLLRS